MKHIERLVVYLLLALLAYFTAASFGAGAGFVLFLVAGGIAELAFWKELFRPRADS